MATKTTPFRFEDEVLTQADAIALHEARRTSTADPNRSQAVRLAIAEAYAARQPAMEADLAAWNALVEMAGSPAAVLALDGVGVGVPLEAGDGLPKRWAELEVSVTLDGHPIDVPIVVEPLGRLSVAVFLSDQDGTAKVYLGPLSRQFEQYDAWYSNRLFRIAADLRMP